MPNHADAYRQTDLSLSIPDRVKALLESLGNDPNYQGWDTAIVKGVQYDHAEPGKIIFSTTVTPAMCNKAGNLHGGCATTLLDNLSSFTFATWAKEGFLDTGSVSRTLNVTMLRPVPLGARIRIVCEAVSAGKNLALCKGQIELENGKIAVTCVHDKAIIRRPKL